jgi:DNA-binding response OmpR family regulator
MELALLGPLPTDQFTLRILLVEDNPGDARMVQETLACQSIVRFEVILASRLGEGLICLNGEHFDAVLLDLSLPDARGLDTLARMRRRAPFIPIVIMTGLSDEALAMKALNEGAQDYLVKGENDAPALARRIRFAIERSRGSSTRPLNEAQPRTCRTLGFIGSKGGVAHPPCPVTWR